VKKAQQLGAGVDPVLIAGLQQIATANSVATEKAAQNPTVIK
jgi:hypothetical protein